jgi:hypothetical protein
VRIRPLSWCLIAGSGLWLCRGIASSPPAESRSPGGFAVESPANPASILRPADRETPRRALLRDLDAARAASDWTGVSRINGLLAREANQRIYRALKAWEVRRCPETGLIPKSADERYWNGPDTGADCFPFLFLASRALDPGSVDLWQQTMFSDRRLCGVLPKQVDLDTLEVAEVSPYARIFGASEYAKDGLLAITERLGRGPWFDRMVEIARELAAGVAEETPRGAILGNNTEINGNMLQLLSRLYWATREELFLTLAERTAEAYLLEMFPRNQNLPALYWDFKTGAPSRRHRHAGTVKYRDHGNEIIPGLAEIYYLETALGRPQAERYREPIRKMLDQILVLGRSPDGLWYDNIHLATGKTRNRLSDNWGYLLNALHAFDVAEGTDRYADEIVRAMRAAAALKSYGWERAEPDGYADAIESMLYMLPWFDLPEGHAWVDDEIEVMFAFQQPSGFVQGNYLDGNFIRTALMYARYKSLGVRPEPWRPDLAVGAARHPDGGIVVHVSADAPWSGALVFDQPHHRVIWGLPRNYPRLNACPEWFAIDPAATCTVQGLGAGEIRTLRGEELVRGLRVSVDGVRPVRFSVRVEPAVPESS